MSGNHIYFVTDNITSDVTQSHLLVSVLPLALSSEVTANEDQLTYLTMKSEILRHKRYHQLIYKEILGDKSPSQLLRRIRDLAESSSMDEDILKQLFFSRLPNNVQAILTTIGEK
ncbi:Hypothetical predicted protein [Octopus vulgaris]|uniref:Uncharacterized protein n=1 Tax=Octopus vulgaris TaxID=6645 RepID=A0AA36FBW6_OCTVU|nr:Hypothetical predicted protein [Octopus vulgaris]